MSLPYRTDERRAAAAAVPNIVLKVGAVNGVAPDPIPPLPDLPITIERAGGVEDHPERIDRCLDRRLDRRPDLDRKRSRRTVAFLPKYAEGVRNDGRHNVRRVKATVVVIGRNIERNVMDRRKRRRDLARIHLVHLLHRQNKFIRQGSQEGQVTEENYVTICYFLTERKS